MSCNDKEWSSRYINSIWSDTSETWDKNAVDWRIVGSNPFRKRISDAPQSSEKRDEVLYLIEFPSRRLNVASYDSKVILGEKYVILEADRGIHCGMVKGITRKSKYDEFIKVHGKNPEFVIKRIQRIANQEDLVRLGSLRQREKEAFHRCSFLVRMLDLQMEILDCEYQFDGNKITFFYRSAQRIDFRELVKELFKSYKTRIWMCSVNKAKDKLLDELLK